MTEPAVPPPPTDPGQFDDWARSTVGNWGFAEVDSAARAVLNDPSAELEATATAVLWVSVPGPGDVDRLRSLSHEIEVSPDLRARVAAMLARQVSDDRDQAVAVCERAVEDSQANGASTVARVVLGRALVESLVGARSLDEAQQVLEETQDLAAGDPELPDWARLGLTHAQLVVSTARRAAQQHARVPPSVIGGETGVPTSVIDAEVADQARAVIDVAATIGTAPAAVAARIDSAGVLISAGAVSDAIAALEAVVTEVESIPSAWSARYRGLVALADAHVADERFDRAVEVQQAAIQVASDNGSGALVGLGNQGLARQLRSLGRIEEASAAYAVAAELVGEAGGVVESLRLRLERAEVHTANKDPQRAVALGEEVLAELAAVEGMPDDLRHRLAVSARQTTVGALMRSGDLTRATDMLIDLADLEAAVGGPSAAPRSAAGVTAARSRQWTRSLALLDQATAAARSGPDPTNDLGLVAMAHASALESAQSSRDALAMATSGLAVAREAGHTLATGRLAGMLGSVHLDNGDPTEAEAAFRDGLAAAEADSEDHLARQLHRDLARALDAQGRTEEAEEHRRAGAADE